MLVPFQLESMPSDTLYICVDEMVRGQATTRGQLNVIAPFPPVNFFGKEETLGPFLFFKSTDIQNRSKESHGYGHGEARCRPCRASKGTLLHLPIPLPNADRH